MIMSKLTTANPQDFFGFFEEIAQIPHPSFKEERISDYLVAFAKDRGLEHYQDEVGNVIIIKEASEGYEDKPPIILQGHMDMVCEKEPGCKKNMEKEGLDLYVEGDYIRARSTTLGADDGVAVAYALSFLDSKTLRHPRLEFVCTTMEEVGLRGANAIDVSMLRGKRLINIDSSGEAVITAGCAGGCSYDVMLALEKTQNKTSEPNGNIMAELTINGLSGGHSGLEIDKCGGNATHLLSEILLTLHQHAPFSLVTLEGGLKDNAIPRDAKALMCIPKKAVSDFEKTVLHYEQILTNIYADTDPDISIRFKALSEENCEDKDILSVSDTTKVLSLMQALPNGVQKTLSGENGCVVLSLNLGVCELKQDGLLLRYCLRSNIPGGVERLINKIESVGASYGATGKTEGNYPEWAYKKDSPLREAIIRAYETVGGYTPQVEVVHAGLECGVFAGKIDDLDAVSIGPDAPDIHTTEERLSISSAARLYDILVHVIEEG